MLQTSGRCSMPFACHAQAVVGHGNDPLRFASTAPTALAITGNRFKPEASGAFVLNGWMRKKVAYAKGAAVEHRRASMHKLTKAGMSSNVRSIG